MLFSKFKLLTAAVPLSFVFMIALRAMKIVATVNSDDMASLWDGTSYHALYIINAIMSATMYVGYLHMITVLGKVDVYLPGDWNKNLQ
jgi:Mg2+/citrate symporter